MQSFCATLPEVKSDIKWGADLCFTIDAKMFAVFGLSSGKPSNLGFKCDPERFLELTDQDGIIPAPYLARDALGPGREGRRVVRCADEGADPALV
jgi:predicted DNA-binding protein (MmcQ/YjbR family)